MKRFALYTLSLAALLMAVGCAQPSDNDKDDDSGSGTGGGSGSTSNYKVSIDFPSSLLGSDSAATGSYASRTARAADDTTSYAYENIKMAIDSLKTSAASNALYGIMLLTVIDQNSLQPSATTVTDKSITLTQELVDAMTDAMPESTQDGFESDMGDFVGQMITVPDFVYQTSTNTNFDFQVSMTQEMENEDGTLSPMETTFYWTDGLTRTAMVFSDGVMAYDDATKSAYMSFESDSFEFTLSAVVDSTNADAHGVYLKQSFTMGDDVSSLTVYADDAGGLAKNSFTGASFSGSFTEGFDSTGTVTYQSLDFSEGMDDQTTGELSATYSAKLEGATSSYGSAETLF